MTCCKMSSSKNCLYNNLQYKCLQRHNVYISLFILSHKEICVVIRWYPPKCGAYVTAGNCLLLKSHVVTTFVQTSIEIELHTHNTSYSSMAYWTGDSTCPLQLCWISWNWHSFTGVLVHPKRDFRVINFPVFICPVLRFSCFRSTTKLWAIVEFIQNNFREIQI